MRMRKKLWLAAMLTGVLAVAAAVTTYGKERLDAPDETFWDGNKATWGEVENAYKYEVRLYREGSYVSGSEVETKKTSYSFRNKMEKEGFYSFRVRALAKNKDKEYSDSNWSEYSDESLVSAEDAERIKTANEAAKQQRLESVNTGGSGPGDGPKTGTGTQSGSWKQDDTGWWYVSEGNQYTKNNWQQIGEAWYYFNDQGYMSTGWLTLADKTYYCDPATGIMQTGAQTIDGQSYNFDASGALIK